MPHLPEARYDEAVMKSQHRLQFLITVTKIASRPNLLAPTPSWSRLPEPKNNLYWQVKYNCLEDIPFLLSISQQGNSELVYFYDMNH